METLLKMWKKRLQTKMNESKKDFSPYKEAYKDGEEKMLEICIYELEESLEHEEEMKE